MRNEMDRDFFCLFLDVSGSVEEEAHIRSMEQMENQLASLLPPIKGNWSASVRGVDPELRWINQKYIELFRLKATIQLATPETLSFFMPTKNLS